MDEHLARIWADQPEILNYRDHLQVVYDPGFRVYLIRHHTEVHAHCEEVGTVAEIKGRLRRAGVAIR